MEIGTAFFYNGVEFRATSLSNDKVKGDNIDVSIHEPATIEAPIDEVLFLP